MISQSGAPTSAAIVGKMRPNRIMSRSRLKFRLQDRAGIVLCAIGVGSSGFIYARCPGLFSTFPLSSVRVFQPSPMARRSITKLSRTAAPASPRPAISAKCADRLLAPGRSERLVRERRDRPPFKLHRPINERTIRRPPCCGSSLPVRPVGPQRVFCRGPWSSPKLSARRHNSGQPSDSPPADPTWRGIRRASDHSESKDAASAT